jgi:hypothetical protein
MTPGGSTKAPGSGIVSHADNCNDKLIYSLFDNAASSWTVSAETARGMILVLDMEAMTCKLDQDFLPPANEPSPSQGGTRQQPNGDVLAGYVEFTVPRVSANRQLRLSTMGSRVQHRRESLVGSSIPRKRPIIQNGQSKLDRRTTDQTFALHLHLV